MISKQTVRTLPRFAAYTHLRDTGAWPDGVPAWAKNHEGRMDDVTLRNAVIEELAQAIALGGGSPTGKENLTVGIGDPVAWMAPDGSRVITAKAKESASSAYGTVTPGYTVPLFPKASVDQAYTDGRRDGWDACSAKFAARLDGLEQLSSHLCLQGPSKRTLSDAVERAIAGKRGGDNE